MTDNRLTKTDKKTLLILTAAVGITCLLVFRHYLFGGRVLAFIDIGSDTAQQYLAQYAVIIRKLRTGDLSLWSQVYGFGGSLYMLNMFNPLLILLYGIGAVFGAEVLPGLLVWWYAAEIVLAAVCAYVYLSVFDLSETIKGIAAYIYAFNGFLIVWGQHYQFGVICLIVPLLLWAVERRLRDDTKWPFLVVITAVCVLNSMYLAYMTLLMAAFYVCFRVFMHYRRSFGQWFAAVFRIAVPMVVGLMIGGISLLPSYAAIANVSARLNSDMTLWQRLSGAFASYGTAYYKSLADSLLTQTGEGINIFRGYLNYYESPNVFFSGLFVFLGAQYVLRLPFRHETRRQKALQAVFLVLAAAGLYFPAAGVILNGFTAPFSRYTFLYMPYFLLITAFTLKEILEEKIISLPAVGLALVFMLWRYVMMGISGWPNSMKVYGLAAAAALGMGCWLIIRRFDRKDALSRLFLPVLLGLLFVNVTLDSYSNFSGRDALQKNGEFLTDMKDPDTLAALEAIRSADTDCYRVEKLYGASFCMDGLFQDYAAVSVYNSTQNRYIIDYVDTYWPSLYYLDQNHYSYANSSRDPEQSGLTGIRYVLDRGTVTALPGYELWQRFGDVAVWKSTGNAGYFSYYDDEVCRYDGDGVTAAWSDRDTSAVIAIPEGPSESRLEGIVETASDGVLLAAIPFEEGWEAYVDGRRTDILRADRGFQAVALTTGRHTVTFRYVCPLFREGLAVSAAGLILFAGALAVNYLKRRKASCLSSIK